MMKFIIEIQSDVKYCPIFKIEGKKKQLIGWLNPELPFEEQEKIAKKLNKIFKNESMEKI